MDDDALRQAYHDATWGVSSVQPEVVVTTGSNLLSHNPALAKSHGVEAEKVYCVRREGSRVQITEWKD